MVFIHHQSVLNWWKLSHHRVAGGGGTGVGVRNRLQKPAWGFRSLALSRSRASIFPLISCIDTSKYEARALWTWGTFPPRPEPRVSVVCLHRHQADATAWSALLAQAPRKPSCVRHSMVRPRDECAGPNWKCKIAVSAVQGGFHKLRFRALSPSIPLRGR